MCKILGRGHYCSSFSSSLYMDVGIRTIAAVRAELVMLYVSEVTKDCAASKTPSAEDEPHSK